MAVLPYDAEVEYLESTAAGREWVNTGFVPSSVTDVLTVDAAYTSAGNVFGCLFGVTSRVSGNQRFYQINKTTTSDQFRLITSTGDQFWTKAPEFSGSRHTYVLNKNVLYIDGTQTITGSGTSAESANLYLFARNNAVTASIDTYGAAWRIYSAKLERNGVVQFDLLPVRVGSVGYFYDKVSGTLLPSGGDPLVVGPDRAKLPAGGTMMIANRESFAVARKRGVPTAADYVADGLVALWDGVENAGYGVHNPAAAAWKNLVGANGGDFVVTAGHFLDNALAVTGTNYTRTAGMPSSPTSTLTVDVAFTIPNVVRTAGAVFSWRFAETGPLAVSTAWSYLRITGGGNGTYGNDTNSYDLVPYVGNTFRTTMTTFVGQNGLYVGGVLARPAFVTRVSFDARYKALLGAGGQAEIRYHSVRVYSRFLSASEIAANAAIDKERFGLP